MICIKKLFPLLVLLMIGTPVLAVDIVWDGGEGGWEDLNWNGGNEIIELTGVFDGSDGWGSTVNEDEMENIIISGADSVVSYHADEFQKDFEMFQGSTLTISDGAVWTQSANDDWTENRWTELDLSVLTLDGGTLRRVGAVADEGGGALIFGSWQGNDRFNEPESELDYQQTHIFITNGGRLENEGELWFGAWADVAANGTEVILTIDDGMLDLTGGDMPAATEAPISADLVFTNHYTEEVDQPTYAINFTGPGSITVDESGIVFAYVDEDGVWEGIDDPITYEALWDFGVLQSNGKSGVDGADFSAHFSVTGQLGADDYTLTSNIGVVAGDFNNDGVLTATDMDLLTNEVQSGDNDVVFDVNGDGAVNQEDRIFWIEDLANSYVGDSNLDGVFDSGDFVAVFTIGEYEDAVGGNSTWGDGDWNGDSDFNSGDFVIAFTAGGFELPPKGAAVNAVPEPSGALLSLVGLFAIGLMRRRLA